MKIRFVFAILVLCLSVAAFSVPVPAAREQKIECPEDGSGAYFTGKTRVNSAGKLMKQYKCNRYGHLFWVRSN